MYFSTIKKIAIVLFLMVLPLSTMAAGLGALNITSSLGEPLNGSIDLLEATPAELASLKANIASESAYSEQGLTRLAVHDDIKLRILKEAGKDILKLTSVQPIDEPFLDLLVVAEWSNGRVVRQYTVLLDPPNYQQEATNIQAPATNSSVNTVIKKAIPELKPSREVATSVSIPQEHLTKKDDTLYKVARRMQPAGVSLDKVLVALYEANPDAFEGKNMNRLKVGKILQAPTEEAMNAISSQYATQEIKLQTANWNEYRNQLAAAVATQAAEVNGEDTQSSSGKIKSAAEDQSIPSDTASKDVVKLSATDEKTNNTNMQAKITALQEEVSAREKGLKEAENRTSALEKQIEDMQKLLALKNDALLKAQEQTAQKEADNSDTVPAARNEQQETQSPEVGSEAAKTPVEEPKVASPPTATPASAVEDKQANFFLTLFDNIVDKFKSLDKIILATVAGVLVLLLVIWFYLRSKDSKKLEDFEQGIMTSGSLKGNTVFGDTASGMVATGDTSFLTDFSHSTGNGLIDTNDVDPIAEAEVYMAYGRDAQAEEILKDAISKEPQRYELHLKLLEMYAANKNTTAFETVASEMYTSLGADHPTWGKVVEIGAKLEPNNPLYQAKNGVIAQAEGNESSVFEQVEAQPVETTPIDIESVETEPAEIKSVEIEPAKAASSADVLEASDFSDSPLAAEADLDFSISSGIDDDETEDAVIDNAFAESSSNQSATKTDLQFDLNASDKIEEEMASTRSEMPGLDFPILEMGEANDRPSAETVAIEAPNDSMLDMPVEQTDSQVALNNNDEFVEDFDFGVDHDDHEGIGGRPANVLDVSGISLDISDEVSFAPEPEVNSDTNEEIADEDPLTPVDDEVETKLELVAAYIDMEDQDGAKELLEEILKEGNPNQRKRADEILASLT